MTALTAWLDNAGPWAWAGYFALIFLAYVIIASLLFRWFG